MTGIPDAAAFAARFPALAAPAPESLAPLLHALVPVAATAGEELIRYGGHSDCLYLIWDGRLRAALDVAGRRLVLGELGPGKWVGEVTLLDQGPATATVVAAEDSRLLALGRTVFERLQLAYPRLAACLMQALSRDLAARLRHTHADIVDAVRDHEAAARAGRRLVGVEEA